LIARCTRLTQILSAVFVVTGMVFPEDIFQFVSMLGRSSNVLSNPMALFFIGLTLLATASFIVGGIAMWMQPIDRAERIRTNGLAAAFPFLAAGVVLPVAQGAMSNLVGQLVFLVAAIRYHAMQGRRGQFLARFLSPQVGDLVRSQGLMQALQQTQLEISVVCCDLRGFTRFSQEQTSTTVANVLHAYYAAVSHAVAESGGTIKDFAGDGVLILVGAPIAIADHARRGLELANAIRRLGREALSKWNKTGADLGLGVGVASGNVIVGIVDAATRLEYMAVGPAVNLSSRLCSTAADGEIRVAAETARLANASGLTECEPVLLKGIDGPITSFAA